MLSDLLGSPKQITKATYVREAKMKEWQRTDPQTYKTLEKELKEKVSAAWWLDHRFHTLVDGRFRPKNEVEVSTSVIKTARSLEFDTELDGFLKSDFVVKAEPKAAYQKCHLESCKERKGKYPYCSDMDCEDF